MNKGKTFWSSIYRQQMRRRFGKGGGAVDEHRLARILGWVGIGAGTVAIVAPVRAVSVFGMGERPNLGRVLGARDLVLGVGTL